MLPLVCPGISKTPQHIQNISDVSVMRSRSTGYPSHYQANFLREVREKLDSIKKDLLLCKSNLTYLVKPLIGQPQMFPMFPMAAAPQPRQPSPVQPPFNVQPPAQDFEAQWAKPKTMPNRKIKSEKSDQSEPPRQSTQERRQPDY
jgi:hypothetical protein